MADVGYYNNALKQILENPTGSPGFEFGLNQGLGAINRSNSKMRGSGNALAALTKFGTGYALQDYGNQVDRMGRLLGQEQGYELGQGNLKLGNDRLGWDKQFGQGQLDNTRRIGDQNFGLGMYKAGNEFALGSEQNANTAQNNWWNYNLGQQQNNNTAANNENNYNLGWGRNAVDWYNAGTNRGNAQSQDWERWMKNQGGYA